MSQSQKIMGMQVCSYQGGDLAWLILGRLILAPSAFISEDLRSRLGVLDKGEGRMIAKFDFTSTRKVPSCRPQAV